MSYFLQRGASAQELTDDELDQISGGFSSQEEFHPGDHKTTIECYNTSDGGKVCSGKSDPA